MIIILIAKTHRIDSFAAFQLKTEDERALRPVGWRLNDGHVLTGRPFCAGTTESVYVIKLVTGCALALKNNNIFFVTFSFLFRTKNNKVRRTAPDGFVWKK